MNRPAMSSQSSGSLAQTNLKNSSSGHQGDRGYEKPTKALDKLGATQRKAKDHLTLHKKKWTLEFEMSYRFFTDCPLDFR